MQQEYKEAMEKISLSDSDKKRILANVKKACEESEEKVISMDEFKKRPRFSTRQKGMAAAVAVLVVAITAVVSKGFFGGKLKKQPLRQLLKRRTAARISLVMFPNHIV